MLPGAWLEDPQCPLLPHNKAPRTGGQVLDLRRGPRVKKLAVDEYPAYRYIRFVGALGMTEPAFFVLTALADKPRHGYGILQEVEALSGGRVLLKVGTLYGVLERLVADELVVHERDQIVSGRLRRYYRLTDAGASALLADAERQRSNARVAVRRLRPVAPRLAGGTA
jgi:PadR family transcriptional regulator PadR